MPAVSLATIAREWGRLGAIGFGGPPAHVSLLRRLCVERRKWLTPAEFEDAIAATNLLPGPASTQLAIFCGWRLRGAGGALVGGLCFILPGLVAILGLSVLFLDTDTPLWLRGAASGAGSVVAAVAVHAAAGLVPPSWRRAADHRRWLAYGVLGMAAAALLGPFVVLVLLGCGVVELTVRSATVRPMAVSVLAAPAGGLAALVFTAFKVGALSYGGGFVIIPLMHSDAVDVHHWLTKSQFLQAVAFGQITPGPVVHTVAVVGYGAGGLAGALLAAAVAFGPSFAFVIAGAPRFARLRGNRGVQAFLDGAGPAAIGAIAGSAVLLAVALTHLWQVGVLAAAALWLAGLKRGVVSTLLVGGVLGIIAASTGVQV